MTDNSPRIRTRADLEEYLGHFNARRYEQQIAYYAPDVIYKVGSLTLTSPRQIADFYSEFHQHSKEKVELVQAAIEGDIVGAVVHAVFEPFKDYVKNGLVFKAGVTTEIVSFAFYRLKDGRIHRIRMARYPGPVSDFE
jgi:predicted SnoaL-like aldol condensation-catalyzing enzyme